MNDDTVPDVGMTIGSGEAKVPSQSWRKCLAKALVLAAFCVHADVETVDGIEWTYSLDGGKAVITSALDRSSGIPHSVSGRLAIPASLGGRPVAGIGDNAFCDCCELVSVEIPEGVETIGAGAFRGCVKLAGVSIPDSVTAVMQDAFGDCSSALYDLTTVDAVALVDGWIVGRDGASDPATLNLGKARGIVQAAFAHDRYLRAVSVSGGVPSVPAKAFYGCGSLELVVFLGPVGEIGAAAFGGCVRLAGVSRMSGVTNIAACAFSGCSSLERISIPGTVRTIGCEAFSGCIALASVEFIGDPDCICIDDTAFYGCMVDIGASTGADQYGSGQGGGSVPDWRTELAAAADARLCENISDEAEYASFKAWAGRLPGIALETVKASPCAWLSYALDSASLIASAPGPGDVRITGFCPSGAAGTFDMSVSVAGVSVGGAATAANLAKVFAVEGAAAPVESMFGTNGVDAVFGAPVNGLVKLSVSPKNSAAQGFFFRVKPK